MYGILFFNLHTLFSTKFSIMLFFHLPYRKLTSNIENSKSSFEKTKKPPGDFSSLNTTAYPRPYSISILSKNQKQSNPKQKSLYSKVDTNKTTNQIRIPD